MRRAGGLQRRKKGSDAPDAAEVVDPRDALDPLRVRVEEPRAAGDPGVVYEQTDLRVAGHDGVRHLLDGLAVAHVADLVLGAEPV